MCINEESNEMTLEHDPMDIDNESNQLTSDNERMNIDDASDGNPPVVSGAQLEKYSVTSKVASKKPPTVNVISTSSGPGLLSLPPELRVHVFRYLLLKPHPLSDVEPIPAILSTCQLIRREAFQVIYGENFFDIDFYPYLSSMLTNQHIRDAIQNIHFEPELYGLSASRTDDALSCYALAYLSRLKMITLVREFGSPAIVRGTLNIIFHVGAYENSMFPWFLKAVHRFTNFRIIQFEFHAGFPLIHADDFPDLPLAEKLCPHLCDVLQHSLTPVFGPAQAFANGCGRRFYPQRYLSSLPLKVDVDWPDYLDGIRLDWNRDPTNADEPEAPTRKKKRGLYVREPKNAKGSGEKELERSSDVHKSWRRT